MTKMKITDVQKTMRSHIGQRVQAGWDSGVEEGIYRGQSPHNSTMSRIDLDVAKWKNGETGVIRMAVQRSNDLILQQ